MNAILPMTLTVPPQQKKDPPIGRYCIKVRTYTVHPVTNEKMVCFIGYSPHYSIVKKTELLALSDAKKKKAKLDTTHVMIKPYCHNCDHRVERHDLETAEFTIIY